ncbi:MAG: YwmB family TATA-box binding protein [Paeniclostridium sp.]|nr:YwmB family TATA-box binding protein [Paeniclostridium sp.]MBW4862886.1 YwmB family TATA-box binding protein [Paeniclostridium sp.]
MKKILMIISLVSIFLIGIFVCYEEVKANEGNNGYKQVINTFESINSEFKFYNIKANSYIYRHLSKGEMKNICLDIISSLGLEESNIKWIENKNKAQSQVYAQIEEKDKNISIIVANKSKNESYIIVDILENKVYKDIVDIYRVVENSLNIHSDRVDIYTCLAGEYEKKLQVNKYDDILQKILYNMNAKEIDRVEEENFISITAFSKDIKTDYIEYLGNKVNLNIGIRYSENEEKTMIYIATPIIKLDY